jgi:iron complex transport system substrate-binding protein
MNPDMAAIEALHPSLILTSTSLQRGLAERLRAKGFHVLHFEPASLADILAQTEQIGSAIGKADAARRITRRMRGELDAIKSKSAALRKVRVYMEINHEGPWTIGTASPLNDLIEAAGGSNIFASDSGGAHIVTHEEILRRDPEVILSPIWLDAKLGGLDGIVTLASITARPGYSATTAVRSSRVLYYDSALLKHEGPRQILAIKKLAYLLHPEVFPNPPGTIPWELGRVRP